MSSPIAGKFYWVRLRSLTDRRVDPGWQPARYTGKSADTHTREETRGNLVVVVAYSPDTWDFIGFRSEDGHRFVEVFEVGSEVWRVT